MRHASEHSIATQLATQWPRLQWQCPSLWPAGLTAACTCSSASSSTRSPSPPRAPPPSLCPPRAPSTGAIGPPAPRRPNSLTNSPYRRCAARRSRDATRPSAASRYTKCRYAASHYSTSRRPSRRAGERRSWRSLPPPRGAPVRDVSRSGGWHGRGRGCRHGRGAGVGVGAGARACGHVGARTSTRGYVMRRLRNERLRNERLRNARTSMRGYADVEGTSGPPGSVSSVTSVARGLDAPRRGAR